MSKVKIVIGLAKSRSITLPLDDAIKLLKRFADERGMTPELEETIRFLENFDVFYDVARKKHKDYLTPPQDYKALLEGRVVVEKIKLEKEGEERKVTIIFHRSVPIDEIKRRLEELGYTEVEEERIALF